MMVAPDKPSIANEAACPAVSRVATASERGDHGKVRNEQAEGDEKRQAAFVREPEKSGQSDQHKSDGRALGNSR
ncbi:hypothetical protein OWR29_32070 [Actinoplanes sp. Pm04-4]|uniref:Uncharacterized protein n=1 Tax=Paractinoplanes pyxinae TaxID=2997416 RepID=A0ABT4B826_9ACTN|nr:hypothetical protein [Actinoplanes pyxinae]MCY1142657.1 hypothetical protein [Actinoplanes pyxinae]